MSCISLLALFSMTWAQAQSPNLPIEPNDYAWRWPLQTPNAASAYLLRLTPEIYSALQATDLSDLAVFNAQGQRVPIGMLPPTWMASERLVRFQAITTNLYGESAKDNALYV